MSQQTQTKQKRRNFTSEVKAKIIREILSGTLSVADAADKYDIQPTQLHTWRKQALEGLERAFQKDRNDEQRQLLTELAQRDDKISELREVVSELSSEVLTLKKVNGVR